MRSLSDRTQPPSPVGGDGTSSVRADPLSQGPESVDSDTASNSPVVPSAAAYNDSPRSAVADEVVSFHSLVDGSTRSSSCVTTPLIRHTNSKLLNLKSYERSKGTGENLLEFRCSPGSSPFASPTDMTMMQPLGCGGSPKGLLVGRHGEVGHEASLKSHAENHSSSSEVGVTWLDHQKRQQQRTEMRRKQEQDAWVQRVQQHIQRRSIGDDPAHGHAGAVAANEVLGDAGKRLGKGAIPCSTAAGDEEGGRASKRAAPVTALDGDDLPMGSEAGDGDDDVARRVCLARTVGFSAVTPCAEDADAEWADRPESPVSSITPAADNPDGGNSFASGFRVTSQGRFRVEDAPLRWRTMEAQELNAPRP